MSENKNHATLIGSAAAILKKNDQGHYTVPSQGMYPHQWLWDSCFTAIGLRHIDIDRAQTEVTSLFLGQWHDGMVPHMIFNGGVEYQAEHRMWQSSLNPASPDGLATSGITQPPLLAEAVVRVGQKLSPAERNSWYKKVFPGLLQYHLWLYRERDPDQTGLVTNIHPWETGLDNSPPWMHEMHEHLLPGWIKAVRSFGLDGPLGHFRRDLRHIPLAERYATLDALAMFAAQRRLRRYRYDSKKMIKRGIFAVQDAVFNAILIRNNELLADIAKAIDVVLPEDLQSSISHARTSFEELWDPYTLHYYPRDAKSKRLLKQPSIATLLALYAGCISQERAAQLVTQLLESDTQFGPAFPVPSVPISSPWFDAKKYWQGPTWVNMNWLVTDGLKRYGFKDHAAALRDITLELVETQGAREYFDPLTGKGLGAREFSWTAALAIDLAKSR